MQRMKSRIDNSERFLQYLLHVPLKRAEMKHTEEKQVSQVR